MDEKVTKLFLPVLDKLFSADVSEPFRDPVDPAKYGCWNYYHYIKHPIDLTTIRNKLSSHKYEDAWRVVADTQLMFSNSWLYNKKGTPVYDYTNKLNKLWIQELSPVMPRFGYCCSSLHKFGPQLLFCHGTTDDKYCQIAIGAKYKCYQDQYSFCILCFNRIDSDLVNIQPSCETTRMKFPPQPVKKSDFQDCTNDHWQYELFIQCTQCIRRVHQICELYPADDSELDQCIQHSQIESEQKLQCKVPREYRSNESRSPTPPPKVLAIENKLFNSSENQEQASNQQESTIDFLDDELRQIARDIDEHTNSLPSSPTHDDRFIDSAKETFYQKSLTQPATNENNHHSSKTSVDTIAARLSNKYFNAEKEAKKSSLDQREEQRSTQIAATSSRETFKSTSTKSDKFVCNHCYTNKMIGFNLRHRKWSARRLPHTRMSKYIETKVNELIRENSPTAGGVTIKVLTAYRDIVDVKNEMKEYIKQCREKASIYESSQHPFLKDYPEEFSFTNRAIVAWQEIDGVDVCVFGMHVQEYGEDCPEPNKQVVYLSYLDSVHFFRPKQFRTAVYHEILLSYFKYVKKLGFKRVFIWVCPSRKGDDYIFYRHPTEQKMPTLKRLSDWYVNLLDKGLMAGIVERHQNIQQYASSYNWTSILSMPYLSGDYWPGEFERLLKVMIESRKQYEIKLKEHKLKEAVEISSYQMNLSSDDQHADNMLVEHLAGNSSNGTSQRIFYNTETLNSSMAGALNLALASRFTFSNENDINGKSIYINNDNSLLSPICNEKNIYNNSGTPGSSSIDQPLDLSKGSSTGSPGSSVIEDDTISESSYKITGAKRKRRKSASMGGYTKRRNRSCANQSQNNSLKTNRSTPQALSSTKQNNAKTARKSCTQQKDSSFQEVLLDPEVEMSRNLERSLKRQKDGFIVAHLIDCDCSPHFERNRREEETLFTCELMKGRDPLLQLARLKNYEFSTLRRAKFSSLAMVKHLSETFVLDPICSVCYSFDSSKRYYACGECYDYYLCTSCYDNTQHRHRMSILAANAPPDIDEFLAPCSIGSVANSVSSTSSYSSTISSLSSSQVATSIETTLKDHSIEMENTLRNHTITNSTMTSACLPLSAQRRINLDLDTTNDTDSGSNIKKRIDDGENSKSLTKYLTNNNTIKSNRLSLQTTTSHASTIIDNVANNNDNNIPIELDQVLMKSFISQAEVSYDVDFDEMKNESKKMLSHYWNCPAKDTCNRCKFVVLSCSFMSALLRNSRRQLLIPNSPSASNRLAGLNSTPLLGFNNKDNNRWPSDRDDEDA